MSQYFAIEFDNGINNTHVMGYLRVPDDFPSSWVLYFRSYLIEKYKIANRNVDFYLLRFNMSSDQVGKDPTGYENLEDDFNLALRSIKYFPECGECNAIRRKWSQLDPESLDYHVKER